MVYNIYVYIYIYAYIYRYIYIDVITPLKDSDNNADLAPSDLGPWALAREIPEEGFPYTTVQANQDYAARLHVDDNNIGISCMMALGRYGHGGCELEQ